MMTQETATSSANGKLQAAQGNVEAMMKSGQVWTAGCQAIGQTIATAAQVQFEHGVTTCKAMAGIRTLHEAIALQSHFARVSMQNAFAGTGKLADASFRLAEQTMAPMTERLTLAAQGFSPLAGPASITPLS